MKIRNFFYFAFAIPFLLEATFIPMFTILIPGSPLSLGRICLVLLGGMEIKHWRIKRARPLFFYVMFFLVIGTLLGTLFSENFGTDFIAFLGFSLLLISSYSASNILRFPKIRKLVTYFFIFSFFYWVFFVFSTTIVGGRFAQTYGEIYRANRLVNSNLINYHSFGLLLSCSILYLDQLYSWLKKLNPIGIIFILLGIGIIIITESRANLLIVLFALFFFYTVGNGLKLKTIFVLSLALGVILFLVSFFMGTNESLARRFDLNDAGYIEQTTKSRFDFIWLVFDELGDKPFGRGANNTRVEYNGIPFQPHNQYLTFILFAGLFGIIANIFWVIALSRQLLITTRYKLNYLKPFLSVVFVTMATLLTNDVSGAFFFLVFMIQSWVSKEIIST